jgi:cytochrome P450
VGRAGEERPVEHARPQTDPIDVSSIGFWAGTPSEREQRFRALRDERPISWHPPAEGSLMPHEGDGFWAITRHEDVVRVSRSPKAFCSGRGVMLEEVPEDLLDAAQSFLAMDAPEHTTLRKLISSAFTPRNVRRIEDQIREQARRIVDELLDAGDEGDFVEQVARKLPMWTIYEMMGLPGDERAAAARAADGMVSWNDEDVRQGREPGELLVESLMTLVRIGNELAEDRRAHPRDDLMTALVQAEVDGRTLTDEEIGAFFVLLSVAGNDTTRNTITGGLKALTDFPDQRRVLLDDFDGTITTAVEEMIRWVSPVMTFRRTATSDVELGGQQIREGDWLVMFYASANRDERVFDDPHRFDVRRSPNDHVGFGGGGPHFCLGNQLARTQLRSLFDQLLHRAPDIQAGEPVRIVGNFVDGVKAMPYRLVG